MHTYIHTYMHAYVRMYIGIYIYMGTYMYVHIYIHVCRFICFTCVLGFYGQVYATLAKWHLSHESEPVANAAGMLENCRQRSAAGGRRNFDLLGRQLGVKAGLCGEQL